MVDIIDSVQLTEPGSALVDLFEIELADTTLYFYPGLVNGTDSVYFPNTAGDTLNEYLAIPIEFTGLEITAEGAQARPTLTIANIIGAASGSGQDTELYQELAAQNALSNEYLIGRKLVRRRTLATNLLLQADPPVVPEEMPLASYIIERIEAETGSIVTFELTSPLDVEGVQIPNRVVVGKYCSWEYQSVSNLNRGGCVWNKDSWYAYADGATLKFAQYFWDKLDRPCIDSSVPANSVTPFTPDELVTYGGKKWRCNEPNTDNPSLGNPKWQVLVEYTAYNAGTTYNYAAPPVYDAVFYDNKLWVPKRKTVGNTPQENSYFWSRFDLCGKTINSCKIRYQALPNQSKLPLIAPSATYNTQRSLYFGGFPGTTKFK